MELVEFTLSDGRRKVAFNPLAVARVEEVNATTTNVITLGTGGSSAFTSVKGNFEQVMEALNVGSRGTVGRIPPR